MNSMLLRNVVGRMGSLQSFSDYRASEARNPQQSSVTSDGALLEYETLELRIHPPNVQVDNEAHDDITVITVDSANRPGTLVEVVQCLTELDLSIRRARISSDGGWFVDEFYVSEISPKTSQRGKVINKHKIEVIKKVLNIDMENSVQANRVEDLCTVFQLSGRDRPGLFAAVLQLLTTNGCDVLSAAVWTFHNRVALVLSVTERGLPVAESAKLERLQQILSEMLGHDDCLVNYETVRGEIHHERRLHVLLLMEEDKSWRLQNPPEPEPQLPEDNGAVTPPVLLAPRPGPAVTAPPLLTGLVVPTGSPVAADFTRISGGGAAARVGSNGVPEASSPSASLSPVGNGPTSASSPLPSSAAAQAAALASAASSGNSAAAAALAAVGMAVASAATAGAPSTSQSMTAAMLPAPTATLASDYSNMTDSGTISIMRADVKIQHSPLLNYWLINIRCKDRNKLFFDTVCALSDMKYDVYHATIDSEGEVATQLFYVRPRHGTAVWDEKRASRLKYMLESCVQRRYPKGTTVTVQTAERTALADLFGALSRANFCITRADIRTASDRATYNFSITDARGAEPEPYVVQAACESQGGVMVDALEFPAGAAVPPALSSGRAQIPRTGGTSLPKFNFSVSSLERKWDRSWQGGQASGMMMMGAGAVVGN